jgi:hypothetical protein
MKEQPKDETSERERELIAAAEEAERHMDDDLGEPVPARVAKGARDVFALRIGAEELDELADAAESAGVSVGAFIRRAALEKARSQGGAAVKRVREQVRELAETVSQL